MDEETRLAAQKARDQEMRERRAEAGIVDDATAVALGTQFVLGDNGCHLRCAACRGRIEEGKDYREFRCTAGCRIVLHPGMCTKSITVPETGEKLASNAWKLGMRCLTDMAQPGDCDGTGILARLTGGAKMVYFEGKMKERDRKPQPAPQAKNPPSVSRKQKAAERAAAAEAAANGGALGGDGAAPSEAAAAAAAAPAAAAPAGPAVPALSAEAAAAAAALAAQEGLTRKERRVPLQRPVIPEHPGARAPAVSSLPPEQLLARSDPVKIIHRRAEERAEEEAEAEAARRAREERQADEDAKAKKPKKQVLPVDIHYRDANADDGQPPPQRRSEADAYEDPISRPAAAAPAASASSASSMASRLAVPATPSRDAFPPLPSAESALSDASSVTSATSVLAHAQRAGAPTSLQAASGAGAAMLRSLLADAGAAATPFLLVEGLDFADFPRGEAGALKWLRDAGGSWHIAEFEAFPTLRAAALRCDSPPDATGLRLLLRQRRLGGREMRVDHLMRWPDAPAVRAADAAERDAAAAAQRSAAAAAAEAEKVAKANAAAARRAEKAAAERAAAERAAVERAAAERAAAERAAAERAKAAAAAAARKSSSPINPRAAPFVPPSAAAPEPPPWANAQVVATQGATLEQYRTMSGNCFGLASDSLAPASAPNGGVFCAPGAPVTALLLLNLDDQTLHGLFRARLACDGASSSYVVNGVTAYAFEALAVGRALPLAEAAALAPSVAAAGGAAPFALSADETARLEKAMFNGRRMHHGAMLTAEEQAALAMAAATSAPGDDAAALVAQMESDEAMALRLHAEEEAAAAAAGRRNGNGSAASAPAMPRPGAPRRAVPAAAPPTPPPAPPPANGWDASFRAADASPYAAAQPWEAQQQAPQQQQAAAPLPQAAPPAPAKRADPMDAMTSALFAKLAAPAPFEPPVANLPPLPGSAVGGGGAAEGGNDDAALQSLFPWMFPQAAAKAQPPPYRPPA